MLYFSRGSETDNLSVHDLKEGLFAALEKLGKRKKVLAVPPDVTRFYSRAGELTRFAWQYYGAAMTDILPALGTHAAMTPHEITRMFDGCRRVCFACTTGAAALLRWGRCRQFMKEVSEGRLDYTWPAQVDKLLVEGKFDLILSFGQVVPHEVIGMANYNKNIFVGTGGSEGINKSHFLGAVYGMERIMGRVDTPVRKVLNYASEHFAKDMPIVYVQTVVCSTPDGPVTRGLFVGDDEECFRRAAEFSLKVNFQMLDKPLKKVVVYLDPHEYKSTWLGNKSIYRTRMAMADGGALIVLAPGLKEFGEDKEIDRLIRKYGYVGTDMVLDNVKKNEDIKNNLSAAAHLIHGSSEGRFSITYCPGNVSQKEIELANFKYADLKHTQAKYDPAKLKDGFNTVNGEEIFFISNPGLGLWSWRERFK